jgi:hypothetical protein
MQILEQSRSTHERNVSRLISQRGHSIPWVRTSYSNPNGKDPLAILEDCNLVDITGVPNRHDLFLEDPDHYNFSDNWERVLLAIPEIVECHCGVGSPEAYKYDLEQEKASYATELEFADEDQKLDIYNSALYLFVRGMLWVQDAEADETGKVKLIWLDEFGQVVRQTRTDDFPGETIGLERNAGVETCYWSGAEYGDAYADEDWRPWPEESE